MSNSLITNYESNNPYVRHASLFLRCEVCYEGESVELYAGIGSLWYPEKSNEEVDLFCITPEIEGIPGEYKGNQSEKKFIEMFLDWIDNKYLYLIYGFMDVYINKLSEGFTFDYDFTRFPDANIIKQREFNITEEAAKRVFNKFSYLNKTCPVDTNFDPFFYNCFDFAQEIYELADLNGYFTSKMEMPLEFEPSSIYGAIKSLIHDFL